MDAHGNVTELLDSECNVVVSYTYDPFGDKPLGASYIRDTDMAEEMSEQSPMLTPLALGGLIIQQPVTLQNPYRYCGEYYDAETGYVYLRARYYDPTLGRFISEDSALDGYNWYVGCTAIVAGQTNPGVTGSSASPIGSEKGNLKKIYGIWSDSVMKVSDIELYLNRHYFLTFIYESRYYTLKLHRVFFGKAILLLIQIRLYKSAIRWRNCSMRLTYIMERP